MTTPLRVMLISLLALFTAAPAEAQNPPTYAQVTTLWSDCEMLNGEFPPLAQGAQPGPQVGTPWTAFFWTRGPAGPSPITTELVWMMVGYQTPPIVSLDAISMTGCWLGVNPIDALYYVPIVTGWNGMFWRQPSDPRYIQMQWTPDESMMGLRLRLQLLIVSPQNAAGQIVTPALDCTVGV